MPGGWKNYQGPLATFHGGPLAGQERRFGGIGPPKLVVACSRETGAIELGVPDDQFEPELWEIHVYTLTSRDARAIDYTIAEWETTYKPGDRVVTLHADRWLAGTVQRVYSETTSFAGARRKEPELYGVRWDKWPRVGNGPDREGYYSEGHRAEELERETDL